MDKKPYAVVYFTLENMYSEIPTSWLLNDEACYWPRSLNARKLMQKGVEPDTNNWEIHQLRIEGFSSTLEGARKKAADSEYSTSNEEGQEAGKGRRKKIPAAWTQDNVGSTSDEEVMTPPPTPKLKAIPSSQKNINSNEGNFNKVEVVAEGGVRKKTVCGTIKKQNIERGKMKKLDGSFLSESSSDGEGTPTPTSSPKQNSVPEGRINNSEDVAAGTPLMLETLYEEIVKLRTICLANKKFLNTIYTKMSSLEFGHQGSNDLQKLKNIPLKTIDEVQEFDLQLEINDDNVKTSLAHLFKSLGGRDGKDHLCRCLAQLFTNELATQCSWFGQRGNFKAKDLTSIKILTDIIISSHCPMSHSDIEKYAGEWFRLSRQRLNREMKKKDTESK